MMIHPPINQPRLTGLNTHLLKSKIKQPGIEKKSKSKQIRHRVTSLNQNCYQEGVGCKEIGRRKELV